MLTYFMVFAATLFAHGSPSTLLLDLRNNGNHRAIRPLADCQWLKSDLVDNFKPDMVNVGFGSVLRIGADPKIKILGPNGKPVWQKTDVLPAYKENGTIVQRFVELEKKHGKRGLFYETPENIQKIFDEGTGFALRPGELIVSAGDPALLRYLFAAPVVEFFTLTPVVEEGITIYRPSQRRGSIAMETLARSAVTVFPTHLMTMTATRQKKKADKATSCPDKLSAE